MHGFFAITFLTYLFFCTSSPFLSAGKTEEKERIGSSGVNGKISQIFILLKSLILCFLAVPSSVYHKHSFKLERKKVKEVLNFFFLIFPLPYH